MSGLLKLSFYTIKSVIQSKKNIMDFNEKLQQLRTKSGLTQEQLAEKIFVSRVAVAKWESGRGYPNLDSLKSLAKIFNISIDDLLSSEELIDIAEVHTKNKGKILRTLVLGITDVMAALLFVIPIFANRFEEQIEIVTLQHLTQVSVYVRVSYYILLGLSLLYGILELIFQNYQTQIKQKVELLLSGAFSSLEIMFAAMSNQPNICIFFFVLFLAKILVVLRTM